MIAVPKYGDVMQVWRPKKHINSIRITGIFDCAIGSRGHCVQV